MALTCTFTSGNLISGCKGSNQGGLNAVFFGVYSTGTTFTVNSTDDTISLITGCTFYKFDVNKSPSSAKGDPKANDENGTLYYDQNATLVINKIVSSQRNKLVQLAQARVFTIIYDNNLNYWLLGKENGCDLADGSSMSWGAKRDDPNRITVSYNAYENTAPYSITALSAFTWSY